MSKKRRKANLCAIGLFIGLILFCVYSIYQEFSYQDIGYLVVVVVCFIRFLYL